MGRGSGVLVNWMLTQVVPGAPLGNRRWMASLGDSNRTPPCTRPAWFLTAFHTPFYRGRSLSTLLVDYVRGGLLVVLCRDSAQKGRFRWGAWTTHRPEQLRGEVGRHPDPLGTRGTALRQHGQSPCFLALFSVLCSFLPLVLAPVLSPSVDLAPLTPLRQDCHCFKYCELPSASSKTERWLRLSQA